MGNRIQMKNLTAREDGTAARAALPSSPGKHHLTPGSEAIQLRV
jgi:hypothetical protein